MAIGNTFYEIGIKNQADKEAINYMVEEAPFLALMPMSETTHGWQDIAEVVVAVDGLTEVDLDAPLSEVNYDSKLETVNVSTYGAKMSVAEDTAKMWGSAGNYFAKKTPKIMARTGQTFDQTLLVNSFRQYAVTNGNIVKAGGASTTNYSIVGVTWERDAVTGIYNPEGFGSGRMLDIKPINGGNLYEIDPVNKAGVLGYGMRLKTNMGVKLLNPYKVGAIVNIDIVNKASDFVGRMLSQLLVNIRGNMNSVFVCHPTLIPYIDEFKVGKLNLINSDMGINTRLYEWNGARIIADYNMPNGNEALVS